MAYLKPRGKILYVCWYERGKKQPRWRSTGFTVDQRQQAEKFREAVEAELEKQSAAVCSPLGPSKVSGGITLEEYGKAWVERRRLANKMDWSQDERRLRLHVYPVIGGLALAAITRPMMLAYVKVLPGRKAADSGEPLSSRTVKNIADTVRAVFADAVEEEIIPASPCVWRAKKHLPPIVDKDPERRLNGTFELHEIRQLVSSPVVPWDRRILYALELLTGMRPGEVLVRRFRDIDREYPPLGRMLAATAWSSDNEIEKSTKTRVPKVIPLHPWLRAALKEWHERGFKQVMKRAPTPDDLIVPQTRRGGCRKATQVNRELQKDLAALGLRKRINYDSRATFRSVILAVRPDLEKFVELMTHPAPKRAAQLYDRLSLYWPGMCDAVLAIRLDASAKARPQRARAIKNAVQNAVHFAVQSQSDPGRGQEKGPGVPGPWMLQNWRALEDLNLWPSDS